MATSGSSTVGLDAVAIAEAIRARSLSPVELVRETLERIAALDEAINSFTVLFEDEALEAARRAERAVLAGEDLGPLHGVPISIKDVIWMRGAPATDGSLALRDFVPDEDAALVGRLRSAGAIVVGKTNNPELCYAGITDNRVYGLTRNPWQLERTPGGSSGGAGASVACGLTPIAIGSDGGGSIRIPSSFCGVAGHKPSFGLVPQLPGFTGWKSLTVNGPLARSVRDLALALRVMAGPHPSDDLSLPALGVDYAAAAGEPGVEALRVAYSVDLGFAPVDPEVRRAFVRAIGSLEAAGWRLEQAHPATGDSTELWTLIAVCEGWASDRRLLAKGDDLLEPRTLEILKAGERYSAAEYLDAIEERARYARVWLEFFERFDLLLTPSMQMTAFPAGIPAPTEIDGRPIDPFFDDWCAFCYPANLTRQPAASVPCGFDETGLPVGLQIMGRRFEDAQVLRAAAAWEEIAPWSGEWPPVVQAAGAAPA